MNPYLLHRRKAFRQTGDPFWANVVFLQNFQGTNGSKPATDQSQYAHALTWNGDAVISTAQSPFAGGSSLALDGSGDWVASAASSAYQFPGDFSIEFFWRPSTLSSPQIHIYNTDDVSVVGSAEYAVVFNSSASIGFRFYNNAGGGSTLNQGSTAGWAVNTWHFVQVIRAGATLTLYRDGLSIATRSSSGTIGSSLPLYIGGEPFDPLSMTGFLGPIRITSAARPIAVPTAPFPTGP